MRRAALVLAAAVVLTSAACATGISRDEAIRRALAHAGPTAHVISAEVQTYTGEERNPTPPHLAWIVRLAGNFQMECPAPVAVCPDVHNVEIVLDFYTGEFIVASFF